MKVQFPDLLVCWLFVKQRKDSAAAMAAEQRGRLRVLAISILFPFTEAALWRRYRPSVRLRWTARLPA